MAKRDTQVPAGGRMFKEDDTILDVSASWQFILDRLATVTSIIWLQEALEPVLMELKLIRRHLEILTGEELLQEE